MLRKLMILALGAAVLAVPVLADSAIRVQIDGKPLSLEVAPKIENGRTLVPFRAIFEALGLKVDWNEQYRIATAYNAEMNVSIRLDAAYGSVNGELKALDAQAQIVNGRTLVPLRFVSEAFGNEVSWDAKKKLVSVTSGFKPYTYTEALPVVGSLEKLKLILDYAGKFQQPVYRVMEGVVNAPAAAEKSVADSAGSAAPAPAHSTTNVQVAGVDEADIVKTDGRFIYQLRSGDIRITEVGAESLAPGATLKLEGAFSASDMYLYGSRLVVIGSRQSYRIQPMEDLRVGMPSIMPPMDTPKTQILFYDVSEPKAPKFLRRYESDGSYVTSRVTGGKLYLIASKWLNTYGLKESEVLPRFTDSLSGKTTTVGFDGIRYFPDTVESNLMITLGFDLNNTAAEPSKGVYLGSGNNVYADTANLVVAQDRYHYVFGGVYPEEVQYRHTTELYRFALDNGTVRFAAKGSVPGQVLNQFSMDSHNGYYRIATTTGETWSGTSANNLYVLDSGLKLKGKLEGLAPTERIYSARFLGDRAYLVTFRQTDPFYVIDLKDPAAPRVLGYLKIPGFSDYLHPYDANTVIGFGKDTVETANGVIQGGLKLAMFDVTDVAHPVEKSRVVLGSSGSWSEVLNNHKALMFSKEQKLFALPVSLYEGGGRDNRFSFQGAYVYSIDPVKGFVLKGTSTHLTPAEVRDSELKWYDTQKNVSRILWIGDSLYTLSDYGIKRHDLATMQEEQFLTH